jgi:heat shock protein HtpX
MTMMNQLRTLMLLATLTALLVGAGNLLFGGAGLVVAIVLAAIMNLGAYWFSDRLVLRMYRAQEVGPGDAPELHALVRDLALRANLPMPRLYIVPDESPNAFATGRSPAKGAVAVTEGLLRFLGRDELAGVIAHELAHIRNRDTLVMSVAATIGGSLSMLADMAFWGMLFGGSEDGEESPGGGLLGIIFAPIAAVLIQMAISRTREYQADETAARITGQPLGLASALRKISGWSKRVPMQAGSVGTAHLLILSPFRGEGLSHLFSTHPPMTERVARLEAMVGPAYPIAA